MLRIPWKIQLGLVACGYAAVLGIAALLIVWRIWQYRWHAADAAQYGGMWAGGDLALEFFICGMLLAVTFVLVLVIYKHETAYTNYAKAVLAVSVTAPASVGLIAISAVGQGNSLLGWACLFRVFASPLVLVGIVMSRLFARFPAAKRITNYALLVEVLTLVGMALLLGASPTFLEGERSQLVAGSMCGAGQCGAGALARQLLRHGLTRISTD